MRRRRILEVGARYHVTARAHRSEMIFDNDRARFQFLNTVSKAKSRYRFTLENFCLMGNHFHMIIRPSDGTCLSAIMQWILSVFARDWNRQNGFVGGGSVWGQRFFSRIIRGLVDYFHTFLYINANPVAAGLVGTPNEWSFGAAGMRSSGAPWVLDDPPEGFDPFP